jgi:hypothetical protein
MLFRNDADAQKLYSRIWKYKCSYGKHRSYILSMDAEKFVVKFSNTFWFQNLKNICHDN